MRRWIEKTKHALMMLFGAGVLYFLAYELYSAWMYRSVYVERRLGWLIGARGWISYDAHPVAFWCIVVVDGLLTVLLVALAIVVIKQYRFEQKALRRRDTRPPLEGAIRQAASER